MQVLDCGWNPPDDWVFGVCQGCGERFMPQLPKQFWCKPCRAGQSVSSRAGAYQSYGRPESGRNQLIMKIARLKGIPTRRELAIAMGVSPYDLRQVVRQQFISPKRYPIVKKLINYLGLSLEKLFPNAKEIQLERYKQWEAEHEPRHTLP